MDDQRKERKGNFCELVVKNRYESEGSLQNLLMAQPCMVSVPQRECSCEVRVDVRLPKWGNDIVEGHFPNRSHCSKRRNNHT